MPDEIYSPSLKKIVVMVYVLILGVKSLFRITGVISLFNILAMYYVAFFSVNDQCLKQEAYYFFVFIASITFR